MAPSVEFDGWSRNALPSPVSRPKAEVDGWHVNLANLPEAIESVTDAAARSEGFCCFTLNLDHLVKLRGCPSFQRAYSTARFVTADGEPVARMARRQWPSVQRTTGADLMLPLCQAAAERGLPVYLFGTRDDVLKATCAHLAELTQGRLNIAGFEAPPQGFDPESQMADQCIERIAESGAAICLVMLGAPKQELFSARAVERGLRCGFVCVGAAADFVAGWERRAPGFMQRYGCEWVWRLAQSPRRLGLRYARCAWLLAGMVMRRRLQGRPQLNG